MRTDADALQRQSEVERIEDTPGIRRELQAGAGLAEAGALLDDGRGDAAPRQRDRRRQPADAGAGDQDVRSRQGKGS